MDFKIVWTDPALADLKSIATRIAAHNPLLPKSLERSYFEKLTSFKHFPKWALFFQNEKRRKFAS